MVEGGLQAEGAISGEEPDAAQGDECAEHNAVGNARVKDNEAHRQGEQRRGRE